MHPLIAAIVGRPALKNLDAALADIEKRLGRILNAATSATNIEVRAAEAREVFLKNPNPETAASWVNVQALKSGGFEVDQEIRQHVQILRGELLADSSAKISAALAEAESGLLAKKQEVEAADHERAERTGEPDVSTAALASLERRLDQTAEGRQFLEADPQRALSLLRTALA